MISLFYMANHQNFFRLTCTILFAIGQEIKTLIDISNQHVEKLSESGSNRERCLEVIKETHSKLKALREQLSTAQSIIASRHNVRLEFERIKKEFTELQNSFVIDDAILLYRMVECIRVMSDKKLIIRFKGGIELVENL